MAPEVIELEGATTKSDIWSLGCTLIELITGKPPYSQLLAMSAMFHIVEDEYPPLPQNISSVSYFPFHIAHYELFGEVQWPFCANDTTRSHYGQYRPSLPL